MDNLDILMFTHKLAYWVKVIKSIIKGALLCVAVWHLKNSSYALIDIVEELKLIRSNNCVQSEVKALFEGVRE